MEFRIPSATMAVLIVLLWVASPTAYAAAERVSNSRKQATQRFIFSYEEVRAAQSKRKSRESLTAVLDIRFSMDERYRILEDEEYVVSYIPHDLS